MHIPVYTLSPRQPRSIPRQWGAVHGGGAGLSASRGFRQASPLSSALAAPGMFFARRRQEVERLAFLWPCPPWVIYGRSCLARPALSPAPQGDSLWPFLALPPPRLSVIPSTHPCAPCPCPVPLVICPQRRRDTLKDVCRDPGQKKINGICNKSRSKVVT